MKVYIVREWNMGMRGEIVGVFKDRDDAKEYADELRNGNFSIDINLDYIVCEHAVRYKKGRDDYENH